MVGGWGAWATHMGGGDPSPLNPAELQVVEVEHFLTETATCH